MEEKLLDEIKDVSPRNEYSKIVAQLRIRVRKLQILNSKLVFIQIILMTRLLN